MFFWYTVISDLSGVSYCTRVFTFSRYQKIPAMFNWSPCTLIFYFVYIICGTGAGRGWGSSGPPPARRRSSAGCSAAQHGFNYTLGNLTKLQFADFMKNVRGFSIYLSFFLLESRSCSIIDFWQYSLDTTLLFLANQCRYVSLLSIVAALFKVLFSILGFHASREFFANFVTIFVDFSLFL